MARRGTINTHKHAQWRQRLQQWQDSGLSVRAYCRQHDLSEPAFHWWRRRLDTAPASPTATPTFLPVTLTASTPPAVTLRLPRGVRLRIPPGCDRQSLADLLALLGVLPC